MKPNHIHFPGLPGLIPTLVTFNPPPKKEEEGEGEGEEEKEEEEEIRSTICVAPIPIYSPEHGQTPSCKLKKKNTENSTEVINCRDLNFIKYITISRKHFLTKP